MVAAVGVKGGEMKSDFSIAGGGTLYLLYPISAAAKEWAEEHIDPNHQSLGNGIAVEHRYIGDIVEGITADGLTVE